MEPREEGRGSRDVRASRRHHESTKGREVSGAMYYIDADRAERGKRSESGETGSNNIIHDKRSEQRRKRTVEDFSGCRTVWERGLSPE